jgi:hypothetical protein
MSKVVEKPTELVLPASVVTKIDVSRLAAELERLDNELTAAAVRAGLGAEQHVQPVMSQQLSDFLQENKLSIEGGRERMALTKQLRALKDAAPVIHMTFAVTADPESLQEMTRWVRTTIDPRAVIAVGLQPALVAGVYVRTPNHVYDLSLRATLAAGRGLLAKELGALRGK